MCHHIRNTDLVRASTGRVRRRQEFHPRVHDRDVRPPAEASFKQEVGPVRIGHLDAIHFDTDMPGRLKYVDALRTESK